MPAQEQPPAARQEAGPRLDAGAFCRETEAQTTWKALVTWQVDERARLAGGFNRAPGSNPSLSGLNFIMDRYKVEIQDPIMQYSLPSQGGFNGGNYHTLGRPSCLPAAGLFPLQIALFRKKSK